MRPSRIILAAFLDGLAGPANLFLKIERPGSVYAPLEEMTTPEMLANYGETKAALLLEFKEKERKRDAVYTILLRINGLICLLMTLVAISILALRR